MCMDYAYILINLGKCTAVLTKGRSVKFVAEILMTNMSVLSVLKLLWSGTSIC